MTWKVDPSHSRIEFSAKHMMIFTVRGRFDKFNIELDYNEKAPARSTAEVQIEAGSISTNEPQRDGHLKSPDFLDVANHPYISFKSTRVEPLDDTHARLLGDLTIRDITQPVTLEIEYAGQAKTPWGTTNVAFSARTVISRKDWNLNWNQVLETGGVLVSDQISIDIALEAIKQAELEAVAVPA